ncbi:MAG TPA: hypothetical protein VFS00_04840 [Polyangiaceae bacterium]|nr:hypothetical protein [Polyangiaceae bacterium]
MKTNASSNVSRPVEHASPAARRPQAPSPGKARARFRTGVRAGLLGLDGTHNLLGVDGTHNLGIDGTHNL